VAGLTLRDRREGWRDRRERPREERRRRRKEESDEREGGREGAKGCQDAGDREERKAAGSNEKGTRKRHATRPEPSPKRFLLPSAALKSPRIRSSLMPLGKSAGNSETPPLPDREHPLDESDARLDWGEGGGIEREEETSGIREIPSIVCLCLRAFMLAYRARCER